MTGLKVTKEPSLRKEVSSRKLRVIRQQFADTMMEYFKLVHNQGYPPEMLSTVRKKWEETFEDESEAGFVLVDRKALEKRLGDFEKRWKETPFPHTDLEALILEAGAGLLKELLEAKQ